MPTEGRRALITQSAAATQSAIEQMWGQYTQVSIVVNLKTSRAVQNATARDSLMFTVVNTCCIGGFQSARGFFRLLGLNATHLPPSPPVPLSLTRVSTG